MTAGLVAVLAVGGGAFLGALCRWGLNLWLNALFPALPPGTLLANLLGAYLMGIALAVFAAHPGIAPEWRLLFVTGFLGSLTTFSAFSAEITQLLQQGRLVLATAGIGAHLFGSLLLTLAGLATATYLRVRLTTGG